jgi:hypothetical protein
MSSFHQNLAQFVDSLRKLVIENTICPKNLLHEDEMMLDNAVFSMEVANRKSKACGKENVDYRSVK